MALRDVHHPQTKGAVDGPLGLMHVQMLLDEEVEALAGARYAREDGPIGTRHESNPGTAVLDGQRVPIPSAASAERTGRDPAAELPEHSRDRPRGRGAAATRAVRDL